MGNYSAMVVKLTSTNAPSATALAQEVNIPQSTLSRWVREYATIAKGGGTMKQRRPQDWTAEEKLNAILEYEKLEEEERGKYLRERGLYSIHIEQWKEAIIRGHSIHIEQWKEAIIRGLHSSKTNKRDSREKRIKELEKELRRKDKALAETAALLVLKKKAQDIWGDPEDGR
jgi:transposase-like protein